MAIVVVGSFGNITISFGRQQLSIFKGKLHNQIILAMVLGVAVGLPIKGIGLILGVDRILDMCRTAVNVFGDACGAAVVARNETSG